MPAAARRGVGGGAGRPLPGVEERTCPVLCLCRDTAVRGTAGPRAGCAIGLWHRMPYAQTPGGMMHGTHFAQFSMEVLHRGAAAVLPQHLPDRWLDALLEEADLLAPGEGDAEEDDRVEECCAGLLVLQLQFHDKTLKIQRITDSVFNA